MMIKLIKVILLFFVMLSFINAETINVIKSEKGSAVLNVGSSNGIKQGQKVLVGDLSNYVTIGRIESANKEASVKLSNDTKLKSGTKVHIVSESPINGWSKSGYTKLEKIEYVRDARSIREKKITEKITNNLALINYVYNNKIKANKKIKGPIKFKVTVTEQGYVQNFRVESSKINDDTFKKELLKKIQRWRFDSGFETELFFTINFNYGYVKSEK